MSGIDKFITPTYMLFKTEIYAKNKHCLLTSSMTFKHAGSSLLNPGL